MKHTLAVLTAVAILAAASAASADVIADYNFGVDSGSPSFVSVDTNGDSVASDLDDSTLTANDTGIITSSNEVGSQNAAAVGVEFPVYEARRNNFSSNSFDGSAYFAFSITASNDLLAWDRLTFDWYRTAANTFSFRVLSSLTDVELDFTQVGSATGFGPTPEDQWTDGPVIDLSSLAALGAGETRYFRLQGSYTGGGGLSTRWLGLDNIQVSVVPEPATMSLLALGGLGVLIRRRK